MCVPSSQDFCFGAKRDKQALVSKKDRGKTEERFTKEDAKKGDFQKVYEVEATREWETVRGRESVSLSISSAVINISVWQGSAPAFTVNHFLLWWDL